MIDMTPPDTTSRPLARTLADYVMACLLAFAAFLILFRVMDSVSGALLGQPTSHHAVTLYLAIAGVSVAFTDPLGLLQRRPGWQSHVRGAAVVAVAGFTLTLAYFAVAGV